MATVSDNTKIQSAKGVDTAICFLSGFGFLALEVLWTRMFAQVLENSVYTFSAVLVILLLCLAAGAISVPVWRVESFAFTDFDRPASGRWDWRCRHAVCVHVAD